MFNVKLFAGAAVTALLAGAPLVAQADTTWYLTGAFNDGGTVSGLFTADANGDVYSFNLTTTNGTGDGFVGEHFYGTYPYPNNTSDASTTAETDSSFRLETQYATPAALITGFANPLNDPSLGLDPIYYLGLGPLYECEGSVGCGEGQGGLVRFGTMGEAIPYTGDGNIAGGVPEPATWAMMLLGVAGLGAGLRGARRKPAGVAA